MVLYGSPRLKTGEGGKHDSGQGTPLGGERLQEAEWTEIELWGEGMGPSYSEASRKGGWKGSSCTQLWKPAVLSFRQPGSTHPASAFQYLKLSLKVGQAEESISRWENFSCF